MKVRMAVLVSGGGTNLQALIRAQSFGMLRSGRIELVVASKAGIFALERAGSAAIPTAVVARAAYAADAQYEAALLAVLREYDIQAVVLAGYMHILSADFVRHYENRMINVHPSLIPAFCGRGFYGLKVHEAALAAGVKVTGATVHLVSAVPDGGRILMQKAVEVQDGDTPQTLQRRVMEEAEWVLLPRAAEQICQSIGEGTTMQQSIQANKQSRDLPALLSQNSYPGRGLAIGRTADNRQAVVYFIMGRSDNSRNRLFRRNGDALGITRFAADANGDPTLVMYTPVRVIGGVTIATNGDQTDTVYEALRQGGTFENALQTRTFEPDAPNFTPRISGVTDGNGYALSILKAGDAAGTATRRQYFYYEPQAGTGHFIHTYVHDGAPLPAFVGEPTQISIPNDIDAFTQDIWNALDADNRISLYVRFIGADGQFSDRLINKHEGGTLQ